MDTKSMREAIPAAKAVGADDCIVGMIEGSADEIDRLRTALEQAERERQRVESVWKSKALEHKQRADTAERQLDEARGFLRDALAWILGDIDHIDLDKIDAHLRDTGE